MIKQIASCFLGIFLYASAIAAEPLLSAQATRAALTTTGTVVLDIDDDGTVYISHMDAAGAEAAKARVEAITEEVKVGKVYEGPITKLLDFGALVNLLPGKDGLLHISQIAHQRVEKVTDFLKEGQIVRGEPGAEFGARHAQRPQRVGRLLRLRALHHALAAHHNHGLARALQHAGDLGHVGARRAGRRRSLGGPGADLVRRFLTASALTAKLCSASPAIGPWTFTCPSPTSR